MAIVLALASGSIETKMNVAATVWPFVVELLIVGKCPFCEHRSQCMDCDDLPQGEVKRIAECRSEGFKELMMERGVSEVFIDEGHVCLMGPDGDIFAVDWGQGPEYPFDDYVYDRSDM